MTVQEWCKSERQWPRHLRLDHARYQLMKADTKEAKDFWLEVIKANQVTYKD